MTRNWLSFSLFWTLFLLGGCGALYETASDVQARQALLDLIQVQSEFHQKNKRFARNLVQISEGGYTLNYHTGIVYLEIEEAGPNSWRAVALPAESTSARVFAFDTNKGGFYEMDEEEVSGYVLGALNYIRSQQFERRVRDLYAGTLILLMAWLGYKLWRRHEASKSPWMALCYFTSLPPLIFAAFTLNHMDKEIVLSGLLQALLAGSVGLAAFCIWGTLKGFQKALQKKIANHLSPLGVCTVLISVFNILVATHTFINYSANPDPLEKYIKQDLPR